MQQQRPVFTKMISYEQNILSGPVTVAKLTTKLNSEILGFGYLRMREERTRICD